MIHIQNPYPRSLTETGMIHANIPTPVYNYLKQVFPGHGNIQAVTNTLINQLVMDLKSNGIERYNLENEHTILAVLGRRSPHNRAARRTDPPNDPGGQSPPRRSPAKRKSKQHSPGKPHRKGDGGKATKGPGEAEA